MMCSSTETTHKSEEQAFEFHLHKVTNW